MYLPQSQAVNRRELAVADNSLLAVHGGHVFQCHCQCRVAQETLNLTNICPQLQCLCAEGVPEGVGRATDILDAGPLPQPLDHRLDAFGFQWPAFLGQPHTGEVVVPPQHVTEDGLLRTLTDPHHTLLGAFPHDPDRLMVYVNVDELDAGQLREPQAGVQEGQDDGPVPHPQEGVVAEHEQLLDVLGLEGPDQLLRDLRRVHPGHGVYLQCSLFDQPVEEAVDAAIVVVHRDWLAVLLNIQKEETDVVGIDIGGCLEPRLSAEA